MESHVRRLSCLDVILCNFIPEIATQQDELLNKGLGQQTEYICAAHEYINT